MRSPFKGNYDIIFNLFTSFGYFENIDDDSRVIVNIKNSLKNGGLGVIDFMNSNYVENNLIDRESFSKANIQFSIHGCRQEEGDGGNVPGTFRWSPILSDSRGEGAPTQVPPRRASP